MRAFGSVRELHVTSKDAEALNRAVGATRFAQNALLEEVKKRLNEGTKQSWSSISLHTLWREIRSEVAPWYSECSKEAFQFGAARLSFALANFHQTKTGRRAKKAKFPTFRKRGTNDSVQFTGATLRISGNRVMLPRIGEIGLKEPFLVPPTQRITSITVRRRAGRWFATFHVREDDWEASQKTEIRDTVGVDLGIGERVATLSNGEIITNPRLYRTCEARLRLANKAVSRKHRGSQNRKKAVARLGKLHYLIACQRADFTHKFTTELVKNHDEIVLEDLAVAGMGRALYLGKSVHDAAISEIRRQITYKCEWYGKTLTMVSRWFPSSKMCSDCGELNKTLSLSDRSWTCATCHTTHDRDLNAAINLAASSAVSACRPGSSGHSVTKLLVGQESEVTP